MLIGTSPVMQALRQQIRNLADTSADVLLLGETGTGKELVARCLHDYGPRRLHHFVAINCGGLPETLFDSEIFGHEAGAYTGAGKRRIGKIEHASGGTLFLDEIESMSLDVQVKLLRVIQERELQRVGGDQTVRVDVRILAATNKDLAREVEEGRFRQDLYYRLNVVALQLPPLRDRGEDIPLLAMHFMKIFAERNGKTVKGFTPTAMDRLLKHPWPGNVRELQHAMERAVILCQGYMLNADDFMLKQTSVGRLADECLNLEEVEKNTIERALVLSNGNMNQAADLLGISRFALYRKISKYEK